MTTKEGKLPWMFGIEIETHIGLQVPRGQFRSVSLFEADDELALEAVRDHLLTLNLTVRLEADTDGSDYRTWKLCSDCSLTPWDAQDMMRVAAPQCFRGEMPDLKKWDSQSIELVSKPLPGLSISLAPDTQPVWTSTAGKYIAALTSNNADLEPKFVAFTGRSCGLHIHFGFPDNSKPPLLFLKHLAILVLVYEPVFNTLHAPHRTSTPRIGAAAIAWCGSNRRYFRQEKHSCYDAELTVACLRSWISECETVDQLVLKMCCNYTHAQRNQLVPKHPIKTRIVNFSPLHSENDERGNTIEFRQPAGTLDGREVAYTVQLYTALLRAAEQRYWADAEAAAERRYLAEVDSGAQVLVAGLEDKDEPTLDDLLRVLRLCPEAEVFWRDRQRKMYDARRVLEEEMDIVWGTCIECYEAERRGEWDGFGLFIN
jgi:hypothetical protein